MQTADPTAAETRRGVRHTHWELCSKSDVQSFLMLFKFSVRERRENRATLLSEGTVLRFSRLRVGSLEGRYKEVTESFLNSKSLSVCKHILFKTLQQPITKSRLS